MIEQLLVTVSRDRTASDSARILPLQGLFRLGATRRAAASATRPFEEFVFIIEYPSPPVPN